MKEYLKIRWIYKFDEKTRLPIQEIDEYFLPMINRERVFTEKIDGTNIRIVWNWHKPQFLWRTDNADLPWKLVQRLQYLFKEELLEQTFWSTEVILYWEWFWWKIQHGINDYQEEQDFILFDIEINWVWLERENVEWLAKSLWLRVVPVLYEWGLGWWIDIVKRAMNKDIIGWQISKWVIEWVVWTPKWWYLDRLWKRIMVKIKQSHFDI